MPASSHPFECPLCGWRSDTTPLMCEQCGCDASEPAPFHARDTLPEKPATEAGPAMALRMPARIMREVSDQAFMDEPLNEERRRGRIKEQVDAYKEYRVLMLHPPARLPADIKSDLTKTLERQYPFSFASRVYYWRVQVRDYLSWHHLTGEGRPSDVPSEAMEIIAAESAHRFPEDYQLRAKFAVNQTDDYLQILRLVASGERRGIESSILRRIRDRMAHKYPVDFTNQKEGFENQVDALLSIQSTAGHLAQSRPTLEAFQNGRVEAERLHPMDYAAQLELLNKHMDSYPGGT